MNKQNFKEKLTMGPNNNRFMVVVSHCHVMVELYLKK